MNAADNIFLVAKIYTDWANHYLEKTGRGHVICDLQKDLRSGTLLAEVVQSVSGEEIPGIQPSPGHDGEALGNIQCCLDYLAGKGVSVQEIQAQDILEGNLKCILTLFYGLSRFKQKSRTTSNSSTARPLSSQSQPFAGATASGNQSQRPGRSQSFSTVSGQGQPHSQSQPYNPGSNSGSQNPLPLRNLSEITESDYGAYSCGSEVYQSITGAQLWSPSHSHTAAKSPLARGAGLGSGTPTHQSGRRSGVLQTQTSDSAIVPSYYLRSLSPPPVVDHYSSGGESRSSNSKATSSSRLALADRFPRKLFGRGGDRGDRDKDRDTRKKKTPHSGPGGSLSEGEQHMSPARLSTVPPKSPLKAAIGKAFAPKPGQNGPSTDSGSTTPNCSTTHPPSKMVPPSTNASNTSRMETETPSRNSSPKHLVNSQQSTAAPPRQRMPEQQANPPPPQTQSSIPQPKSSRMSPTPAPNSGGANTQSANSAAPAHIAIKSPTEARRGIPQPRTKSAGSQIKAARTITPPSRTGSLSNSRSKSPGNSLVQPGSNKDVSRKLRPVPDLPKESNQQSPAESPATSPQKQQQSTANNKAGAVGPIQPTAIVAQNSSNENKPVATNEPPAIVAPAPYPNSKSQAAPSGIRAPGTSIRTSARHMAQQANRVSIDPENGSLRCQNRTTPHINTSSSNAKQNALKVSSPDENITSASPPTLPPKNDTAASERNSSASGRGTGSSPSAQAPAPAIPLRGKSSPPPRSNSACAQQQQQVVMSSMETTFETNGELSTRQSQRSHSPANILARQSSTPSPLTRVVTPRSASASSAARSSTSAGAGADTATGSDRFPPHAQVQAPQQCHTSTPESNTKHEAGGGGYATDSDLFASRLDTGDVSDYSGYMSEGCGPISSSTNHSHNHNTPPRIFKDGISAIRDCLQRSEIKLAESDSEDAESVGSNISDLVNDLSSDISANITSPSVNHDSPPESNASPSASTHCPKPQPQALTQLRQADGNFTDDPSSTSTESVVEKSASTHTIMQQPSPTAGRLHKKTAIVQPQKQENYEGFVSQSSAESSPMSSNKSPENKQGNATIKRCPVPAAPSSPCPSSSSRVPPSSGSRPPAAEKQDVLQPMRSIHDGHGAGAGAPLMGRVQGNVFRLSSTSSVVSEEHEDGRSDDCQRERERERYSGGVNLQKEESRNLREDLEMSRQLQSQSLTQSLSQSQAAHLANLQQAFYNNRKQHQSPPAMKRRGNANASASAKPTQIESDIEWESASVHSCRSTSSLGHGCFSDTEDFAAKRQFLTSNSSARILANNPTMRKFLESRAALARDQGSRDRDSGADIFESSFALMDIRNLREKLANPQNIETQSD